MLRIECDAFYDRSKRVYRVYHDDGTCTRHRNQKEILAHMETRAEKIKREMFLGMAPCQCSINWHNVKFRGNVILC